MKMKSKLEKGGALLLAIALSGEVAAQTKTHHKIRTLQAMSEGFESLIQELASNRTIASIEGRAVLSGLQSSVKLIYRV
jgi:hypothetical protein